MFYISMFNVFLKNQMIYDLLLSTEFCGVKWVDDSDRQKKRGLKGKERSNRTCWRMKEWFSSFLLPCLAYGFIMRLSFVIGGASVFLSCNSQVPIMHSQMERPSTQIDVGRGRTKASIPRLMSLPWASSALSPPAWCWQMELLDTNPPGTLIQRHETEGGMSVKHEWLLNGSPCMIQHLTMSTFHRAQYVPRVSPTFLY